MKTKTTNSIAAPRALMVLLLGFVSPGLSVWAAAPVSLTLKGAWPGYPRGPAQDVAVQGQYAYVADGQGVLIVDVSTPSNLVVVGSSDAGGRSVAVSGHYAYIAGGYASLAVVDVSNPPQPQTVGRYETPGDSWGVTASGDYAYLIVRDTGLEVVGISDPLNPRRMGEARIQGATAVAVSAKSAYVTTSGGLQILDVSDPTTPRLLGSYNTDGPVTGVAVSGNYVYLAEGGQWKPPTYAYVGGGWHVLDVTDPAHPVRVAGTRDLNAKSVTVVGDRAYVGVASSSWDSVTGAALDGSLLVFNVKDPTLPSLVSRSEAPSDEAFGPNTIAVAGGTALIADSTLYFWDPPEGKGLIAYDVSNPASPVRLSNLRTYGYYTDIAIAGNRAYTTAGYDGVDIFDVSDSSAPRRLGAYSPHVSYSHYYQHLSAVSNLAYISSGGVEVVDLSDPFNPTRVGATEGSPASEMVLSGKYLYVAADYAGLLVLDVSNPANPVRAGAYETNRGLVSSVAATGNFAYLTDIDYEVGSANGRVEHFSGQGLVVLDMSDPRRPVRRSMTGSAFEGRAVVAASSHYAYIAHGDDPARAAGLQVFDVQDPAHPALVGQLGNIGSPHQIAVVGNYVYLVSSWIESGSEWRRGLVVLDVGDPTRPVRVGAYETGYYGTSFAVAENLIYLVDGTRGLQILEQSRPPWLNVSAQTPFTFSVSGEPGASVRVQRSANLTDWVNWKRVTLGDTPLGLSDPEAAVGDAHFYRAVEP